MRLTHSLSTGNHCQVAPKSGKRAILKGPRTIETSFSTSSRQLFNQNEKKLKRHIRVNPGEYVIQNNTEPASDFFQLAARKWFDDIQKPKEEKSDGDEKESFGDPEHGEKIPHHLVDDDPLIIFFLPMVLGSFCNPTREKEEGKNRQFIDRRTDGGKNKFDGDRDQRPGRPGSKRRKPSTQTTR